jgi:hypothetical protein
VPGAGRPSKRLSPVAGNAAVPRSGAALIYNYSRIRQYYGLFVCPPRPEAIRRAEGAASGSADQCPILGVEREQRDAARYGQTRSGTVIVAASMPLTCPNGRRHSMRTPAGALRLRDDCQVWRCVVASWVELIIPPAIDKQLRSVPINKPRLRSATANQANHVRFWEPNGSGEAPSGGLRRGDRKLM